MGERIVDPVVHLELRTDNLARACAFYGELFGWRFEPVHLGGATYHAVDVGGRIQGGIVECDEARPRWLPYVEVPDLAAMTERARSLGATVTLEPREGPAGWRSTLLTRAGGDVALWQPKA
ncbi:MAG TPA: VOC family protein [Thermoleophilaceae bacterium]|nr:VOC family protein [Thermoleophilaceae bacterium]